MPLELILYGSRNCCLCERLEQLLQPHLHRLGKRNEVSLTKCDIASRREWRQHYGQRIPVLLCGEEVILEGRPEEAEVAQAMAALAARVRQEPEGRPA